jgi:CO/xanthine dehydrogenase FAD-binding subunit
MRESPNRERAEAVKPASFDYYAPTSVAGAIEILTREGEEARVLAGGQSLVPMMNFRLVRPSAIIDLNRIGSLAFIEEEGAVVRIGAMTRQRQAERAPLVAQKLPLLRQALSFVAHLPIRSRGTIGGSRFRWCSPRSAARSSPAMRRASGASRPRIFSRDRCRRRSRAGRSSPKSAFR